MKLPAALLLLSPLLTLSGCTKEALYHTIQEAAAAECRRQPNTAADECQGRINKQTYGQYEKSRAEGR